MSAITDPRPSRAVLPPQAWRAGATLLVPLRRLRGLALPVLGVAALAALAGVALWPGSLALALAVTGCALAVLALVAVLAGAGAGAQDVAVLARLIAMDPDTLILTDGAGHDLPWPGTRQQDALPDTAPDPGQTSARPPASLRDRLAGWCADPDQVLRGLLAEMARSGSARRDLQRGAAGLRLGVHPLDPACTRLLWRLSRSGRAGQRGLDALGLPVLTLGATGAPVAANPALLRLLDFGPGEGTPGRLPPGQAPSSSLATALAPVLNQLGPLRDPTAQGAVPDPAARPVELRLPGGQLAVAQAVPARDGQCDILFLPGPGRAIARSSRDTREAASPKDYEDIPVALIQLDGDGRIFGTNRAARSLMGLAAAEDRPLWEVVEGLGRPVADWLQDARAGRALNRPEVLRATCSGAETYVQIILRRATDAAPPGALVAVVSDATELKSLEARFVQSQKMQAIGQLAGGIAHDFNNLLTAISGHCDLLLLGVDPYDPDYNDLLQIHQNANRAAALVRQLLAFSRKQTLQPEILTLEDLLEDVVHLLTRLVGERIQLSLHHDPQVGPIRADRRQLEQVIVNLVVNARDAMPMGGEIRIETRALSLAAETTVGRARLSPGTYARIQVIDTGIGIPDDLIDKIFEPFFTTKRQGEGTGLGLSTAYGIVKQMGGYIFVDSVEGSGTTFSLYFAADPALIAPAIPSASGALGRLPAPAAKATRQAGGESGPRPGAGPGRADGLPDADASLPDSGQIPAPSPDHPASAPGPAAASPKSPTPPPKSSDGNTAAPGTPPPPRPGRPLPPPLVPAQGAEIAGIVLLVEDEAPVRAFAARALRLQGYRVLEAEDGEQALEVLADPGLVVDIFVTDVIMPGRDGPTWVAEALRARPGTPVVFVSGYIEDTLTEALGRTPHAVFLEKPFSLNALCRTIAAQLGQGAA